MTLVELVGAKVGQLLKAVKNVHRCKHAVESYERPRLSKFSITAVIVIERAHWQFSRIVALQNLIKRFVRRNPVN
jgi:hypothetical protein